MRAAFVPLALALLAIVVGACASLQGDGFYGCARGGACPASAPFCGGDGLCHTSPAIDAGTSDGAAADDDTGAAPLDYAACQGGSAGACGADTCYYDPLLGTTDDGYCTRSCTSDAQCPAFGGAPSACIAGQCRRGCMGFSDCVAALACTPGRWEDGASLRLCVSLDDAEADWYNTCSVDADCQRPLSCVNGTCLRACTSAADCVLDLELCAPSAAGPSGCVYQCSGAGECGPLGGGPCVSGGCHPSASW